jgi:hypothetical protein
MLTTTEKLMGLTVVPLISNEVKKSIILFELKGSVNVLYLFAAD